MKLGRKKGRPVVWKITAFLWVVLGLLVIAAAYASFSSIHPAQLVS